MLNLKKLNITIVQQFVSVLFEMVLKKLSNYPCSQEIHRQQIEFAKNLGSKIQEIVQSALSSLDTLDVQIPLDKQTLLSETNYFTGDLNRIVFNLQNFVLKLDDDSTTKRQVLVLIAKIVETSYCVQHSFNINPNLLKSKLKASVDQVNGESNDLAQILLEEPVSDHKQKLLDVLSDMLSACDKIRVRNEIRNKPPEVLQELLDGMVKDVWNGLDSSDLNDEVVLHHIVHYIRIGVQHMQRNVHYLHLYGDHYEGNAHELFHSAGNELHEVLAVLQKTFQTTKCIGEMKSTIRFKVHAGTSGMAALASLRHTKDNEGVNTLQEAVDVLITETLVNGYQLARGLTHSGIY